jgi:cell division protein FtsB
MAKTKSKKTAKRGVKQAPKQASKQAPKQGPKQTPTNRARSAKPARATGALSLASIPIEAIAAELKRRQSEIPKLEAHARALRAELAAIEARIATLSGAAAAANPAKSPKPAKAMKVMKAMKAMKPMKPVKPANPAKPGAPRKRRDGQPTLAERILSLLGGSASPRSPREIAAALAPALGREVSQSLLVQISLTLRRLVNAGQIAQPARAQYAAAPTAKGGVADAAS